VEVVHDGDTSQVEQVLPGAEVAGAAALPVPDVGKRVLDLDAFAQLLASLRGLLAVAQLGEQCLVGMDGDAAPECVRFFVRGDFCLSVSGCLSGVFPSRYLMYCYPFCPAVPPIRAFRAVPGLMLRVPVIVPSCSFRAPLPDPPGVALRPYPSVT
jgi:hypothetical protein